MKSGDLDSEVVDFVVAHLESVSHLEALLLIWQGGSAWSISQLAARLYVPEAKVRSILDDLRRRGFVRFIEQDQVYTFEGSWDPQWRIMSMLAEAHRKQLIQISTLIHSKGSASVREFARAFQLKKE